MTEPGFTVNVDQNPYLPEGGRDVSAIVAVTSAAGAAGLSGPADVALRMWTPPEGATVKFVKVVAPDIGDLTGSRISSGEQTGDYPTGAWGPGESRDYHIGVEVAPGEIGQERLAARVSLVAHSSSGTEVLGKGLIRAEWTDDEALSTKINQRVAHYTGQAELAAAIREGLEARRQGDDETATEKLGRAVALAHKSGNESTAKLLAKVVDVIDVETGTVRLKKQVEDGWGGPGLAGVREPRRPRPPTRPPMALSAEPEDEEFR
jgi:von Willebrand factor type A C-terminal domain